MAAVTQVPTERTVKTAKKKLYRRAPKEYSQPIRRMVQFAFIALNLWIGYEFIVWVRHFESGGVTPYVERPSGIEGWLPIAALMNLKAFLLTFELPQQHPAGMFLLIAFLSISIVFRKSFCGWLCPVGTISEYLWKLGRSTFGRTWTLPKWFDIPLRSLKYILLGLFLYAVISMPVPGIRAFLDGPYGVIADVKMLNFFRFLGLTGAIVIGVLVLLSIFVKNFWCRFLCPYGALMGLAALLSPLRITRKPDLCIDCAKCAKACPSSLPVDVLVQINSAECLGCMECVAVCPAEGALKMAVVKPERDVPAWAVAAGVVLMFLGVVVFAQAIGAWETYQPASVYMELVPRAHEFSHP